MAILFDGNTQVGGITNVGTTIEDKTMAEYNALTPEQQANGDYCITDLNLVPLSVPKYKKFTGTTDSYGQLIFGAVSGEIISIFAYGDRLFATLQSNGIARITNQTGAIVTGTQVTLMILYM